MKNVIKILLFIPLVSFGSQNRDFSNFLFEIRGDSLKNQLASVEKYKSKNCSDTSCHFHFEMQFLKKVYPALLKSRGIDDKVVVKKFNKAIKASGFKCNDFNSCKSTEIHSFCEKMDKTTFLSYPFCISYIYSK